MKEIDSQRSIAVISLGILLLSLACGGIGLAYEHDLSGGYAVWGPDMVEQAAVVKKDSDGDSGSVVIPAMVVAYGWNDDFIIARQHPNRDGFDDVDPSVTQWFILQVATGKVYGPLDEETYLQQRRALSIPDSLTFTHQIEQE